MCSCVESSCYNMVVIILDVTYLLYSLVLSVFYFHNLTQELFLSVQNEMQCVY